MPSLFGTIRTKISTVLAVIGLGLTLSACGYNTIPTLQETAKARWADVQNQYQRRADLIPNLVATVQGYAKQEKDVLTQVTEARAKATQAASARGGQRSDRRGAGRPAPVPRPHRAAGKPPAPPPDARARAGC